MSRKQKRGIQPRGEVVRSTTPKAAYGKIGEPQVEIAAWCRDEKAELPPEQVHFILHWPVSLGTDMPPVLVRFKSPDTLGFIIEELIKYRRVVWPDSEKVTGEKVGEYYVEAMKTIEELRAALDASVKLQSHYAELLNMYDGGERMTFKDGYEWVARLKVTGTLPK